MALVAHLEGPKVEGVRKPVYFKTHVDHVEGLTGVFTGASASSAGSSGNVPPPQIGDENKFLCGNGTWACVPSGAGDGMSYSIASASSAGLMSAEDKQHLDLLFQDSADFTDAVVTVVGGKFFPSVDSMSDIVTYKDGNLPYLDNKIKKILNGENSNYNKINNAFHFYQNDTYVISIYPNGLQNSLESYARETGTTKNVVALATSNTTTSTIYNTLTHKISESAGIAWYDQYNDTYGTSGASGFNCFKVGSSGAVTISTGATAIVAAASTNATQNGWNSWQCVSSIAYPNHLMFVTTLSANGNITVQAKSWSFDPATGAATATRNATNLGVSYLDFASKTNLDLDCIQYACPSFKFSNNIITISKSGINKTLPLLRYSLGKYNAQGDVVAGGGDYVFLHFGYNRLAPVLCTLGTYDSSGNYITSNPWLEDNKNVIAGIWLAKSAPYCYAITFKTGTYNYSAKWFDNCSTVWTFDFLTPRIIKTTKKLSDIINDLIL